MSDYISVLESCFALRTLYAVDSQTGAFQFRKNKKFYFTDPLIYWVAKRLSGRKEDLRAEEKLAEMVAHEALARRKGRLGYLSVASGEVDFILPSEWAVEVKWSPVPTNLSSAYKNLVLPFKTVWTHGNYLREFPK
jgi:uncharacterized protein